MDFDGGVMKDEGVVSMNAEYDVDSGCPSSIFCGPENVINRLFCIVSRCSRGGSVHRIADSDNEIGNYLNLTSNCVDSSSPMENEVVANNSNVGRDFGYAAILVSSAIHEVDTNSIPRPPEFSRLMQEDNEVDEYPHHRFMWKYGAALYPRNKQNLDLSVDSTSGCCSFSGDWDDDSSKITDGMNMKLISEALQIDSDCSHEVEMNYINLEPEDDELSKTFVQPDYDDEAQPFRKKRKYAGHSTDA